MQLFYITNFFSLSQWGWVLTPETPRDYATGYYGSYLQSNKNKLQDIFPVGLPPTFGPNSLQISVNFKTDFFKIY